MLELLVDIGQASKYILKSLLYDRFSLSFIDMRVTISHAPYRHIPDWGRHQITQHKVYYDWECDNCPSNNKTARSFNSISRTRIKCVYSKNTS